MAPSRHHGVCRIARGRRLGRHYCLVLNSTGIRDDIDGYGRVYKFLYTWVRSRLSGIAAHVKL
jgi:hypothetical protein